MLIIVVFWGAVFGIGIIGADPVCDVNASDATITFHRTPQYPPMRCIDYAGEYCTRDEYVAPVCNMSQYVFNVCTKVVMVLLTYVNVLPIPWRVSIFVQVCGHKEGSAWFSRRPFEPGLDFYGRPTEAMWFQLPVRERRWISVLLNVAIKMSS